jgi:F420-non-reducing hydrogenase iron-sulfur subunit
MTVKRVRLVQKLLAFVGLAGRVHLEWISSAEAQKFVQVVTDFTEKIRALGPNPLAAGIATSKAADSKPMPAGMGLERLACVRIPRWAPRTEEASDTRLNDLPGKGDVYA